MLYFKTHKYLVIRDPEYDITSIIAFKLQISCYNTYLFITHN